VHLQVLSFYLRFWGAAVVIGLYIALIKPLGYVLSTIGLGSSTMFMIGYKKPVKAIFISMIVVMLVFFVFKVLLDVPLPLRFLNF
jgi:hypothetical protein